MKNFILSIAFLFLLVSCSTESDSSNNADSDINSFVPENSKNPFDSKGKKYYDLLNLYQINNAVPNSAKELSQQIHFISKDFRDSNSINKRLLPITAEHVTSIMDNPEETLLEIIESSTLSLGVKIELLGFVQTLIDQKNDDYEVVYAYIIAYESNIMQSSTLVQDEKDTILTVSSVSRYVIYAEARKDRDWETSVGNRIAQPFFGFNQAAIISLLALLEEFI